VSADGLKNPFPGPQPYRAADRSRFFGKPITLFDRGSAVLAAIFGPDGDRIAASSRRGGVLVARLDGKGEPITLETPSAVIAMAFVDGGRSLFTVSAENTTRTFSIDIASLRRGLLATNMDCLPSALRITYLGEALDRAREGYAACERRHSRTRFGEEGEGP